MQQLMYLFGVHFGGLSEKHQRKSCPEVDVKYLTRSGCRLKPSLPPQKLGILKYGNSEPHWL